jgi:hypothetical protein
MFTGVRFKRVLGAGVTADDRTCEISICRLLMMEESMFTLHPTLPIVRG